MTSFILLYHLARADFLERVRRSSFLVMLVLAICLGYLYLPDSQAGYITLSVDNHRGIYNSAWVGVVCSVMSSGFLSIIGFYLVKNAVARDYQTRVGQILAGTPMTRFEYLLGKTLSNFAVLLAVVVVLLASAGVTQIIRGEDTTINLWHLVAPSLFFAVPVLFIVSALAVLFEVTPGLRGAGGNVIYFFVWNVLLIVSMVPLDDRQSVLVAGRNDPAGFSQILAQITKAANEAIPNLQNHISMGINITERAASQATFVWTGMDFTFDLVGQRLLWVLMGLGVVLIATPIFQRFDATEIKTRRKKEKLPEAGEMPVIPEGVSTPVRLSPLTGEPRFSFVAMLSAELRLMFRTVNRWWLLGALGLVVATLLVPLEAARHYLFPIAWIWPLAIWSSMGIREKKFGVEQVLFSCPKPLVYQLPAVWLAGISIAAVTGIGMLIRFALLGDMSGLAACLVGMVFIPTLALAFGVLSGSQLLFEGVYVALWYIGPMNQVPYLDFMGASPETNMGNTAVFLLAIPLLAVLIYLGRRRQMAL